MRRCEPLPVDHSALSDAAPHLKPESSDEGYLRELSVLQIRRHGVGLFDAKASHDLSEYGVKSVYLVAGAISVQVKLGLAAAGRGVKFIGEQSRRRRPHRWSLTRVRPVGLSDMHAAIWHVTERLGCNSVDDLEFVAVQFMHVDIHTRFMQELIAMLDTRHPIKVWWFR